MKIYFEDGELLRPNSIDFRYHYMIDARYGYTHNAHFLRVLRSSNDYLSVYTNSLVALDNRWAWNEELGVPEIYLVKDGEFVRIDKLTDKELRTGHNIMKMYMAGVFNN